MKRNGLVFNINTFVAGDCLYLIVVRDSVSACSWSVSNQSPGKWHTAKDQSITCSSSSTGAVAPPCSGDL